MKVWNATTTIAATPETIWAILTDGSRYPEWDPYAIRIEGQIRAGAKLVIYTKVAPDRAFPVKVTACVPGQRMLWASGMPFGLFTGERSFTLAPQADGQVVFTLREEFRGALLGLIAPSLPDMSEPFAGFTAGLKARAEGSHALALGA
jgi:hypothetical protein